jgi:predicted transcriptional regulator
MGTIEDVKLKILSFLMEVKEANAKQLEEIAECANKTFLKARQQLEKDGLIQKRYQNRKEGGLEAIYSIPQEKLQTVKVLLDKEGLKENWNRKIDNAPPEDIELYKKKLDELEKELKHYKRLNRMKELEELNVLPVDAVLKKLEIMGFKWQELCPNFYVEDPEYEKTTGRKVRTLGNGDKIINIGCGAFFDYFRPEDIEIILEPAHKYKDPKDFLIEKVAEVKYGPEWIVLTKEPVKGYYILGAYKELLQLYQEEFEFEWLKWKEDFNLSDEDWKIVGPWVCVKMLFDAGRVDLPIEISNYLYEYTLYKKPNAFEELKELYTKHFGKRGAEAQVEETIQSFKRLEQTPVKELWQKIEEDFLPELNETNRRIFQYLKNKYCESLRI